MKKKLLSLLLAVCLVLALLPVQALADSAPADSPLTEGAYLSLGENNVLVQSGNSTSNIYFNFYPPLDGQYTFTLSNNITSCVLEKVVPSASTNEGVVRTTNSSFVCNLSAGTKYCLWLWLSSVEGTSPNATVTITRTGAGAAPESTSLRYKMQLTELARQQQLNITVTPEGSQTPVTFTDGEATLTAYQVYTMTVPAGTVVGPKVNFNLTGANSINNNCIKTTADGQDVYTFALRGNSVDGSGSTVFRIGPESFTFQAGEGFVKLAQRVMDGNQVTGAQVTLTDDGKAILLAETAYFLVVAKGTPVMATRYFGACGLTGPGQVGLPSTFCDPSTQDLYYIEYHPGGNPAPAQVTVGGTPVTYGFEVAEDGENGFLSLELENAMPVQLSDGKATLQANTTYSLKVSPGASVEPLDTLLESQDYASNENYMIYQSSASGNTRYTMYYFEFSDTYVAQQSSLTVTVSGGEDPYGYAFQVTEEALAAKKFLWLKDQQTLKDVKVTDGEATLSGQKTYLLMVAKDTPVTFSTGFGNHVSKWSSSAIAEDLPAGSIPRGYTAQSVDVWVFQYYPSSYYPDESMMLGTGLVTVGGEATAPVVLTVTAQAQSAKDFVSLTKNTDSAPVTLTDGHVTLEPNTSYTLTVKTGTPVDPLDRICNTSGYSSHYNWQFKCDRYEIGDGETKYIFGFSNYFPAQYYTATGEDFAVTIGQYTVTFLDEEGATIGTLSVPGGSAIQQAYPDKFVFYEAVGGDRTNPPQGDQSLKYVGWADQATGKLLSSLWAVPITQDMTLVPKYQGPVAQVTYGSAAQPTVYYSLADATQAVEQYATSNPNADVPAIVMLADYDNDQEACGSVYSRKRAILTDDDILEQVVLAKERLVVDPSQSGSGTIPSGVVRYSSPITVPLTLDLNGHKVTLKEIVTAKDLTVRDSTKTTGTLTASLLFTSSSACGLTVENATVNCERYEWINSVFLVMASLEGEASQQYSMEIIDLENVTFSGSTALAVGYRGTDISGIVFDLTLGDGSSVLLGNGAVLASSRALAQTVAGQLRQSGFVKPGLTLEVGAKTISVEYGAQSFSAVLFRGADNKPVRKDVTLKNWITWNVEGLDDLPMEEGYTAQLTVKAVEPAKMIKEALQNAAGAGKELLFLDLDLAAVAANGYATEIHDTNGMLLAITIDYATAGKNIALYRYHDGEVQAMKKNPDITNGEEGYVVKSDCIVIYASRFSAYAIASGSNSSPNYYPSGDPSDPEPDPEDPTDDDPLEAFTDLKKDSWYYEGVGYAVRKGLMQGVGDGLFSPKGLTTRGQIAAILYRLEGEPAVEIPEEAPFTDVKLGKWYTAAIVWANENGIMAGFGDGTFGPSQVITREQLAAVLYRYSQFKGMDVSAAADLSQYEDLDQVHAYALAPMQWANAMGLIVGRSDTLLAPGGTATRAETASILQRYLEGVGQVR